MEKGEGMTSRGLIRLAIVSGMAMASCITGFAGEQLTAKDIVDAIAARMEGPAYRGSVEAYSYPCDNGNDRPEQFTRPWTRLHFEGQRFSYATEDHLFLNDGIRYVSFRCGGPEVALSLPRQSPWQRELAFRMARFAGGVWPELMAAMRDGREVKIVRNRPDEPDCTFSFPIKKEEVETVFFGRGYPPCMRYGGSCQISVLPEKGFAAYRIDFYGTDGKTAAQTRFAGFAQLDSGVWFPKSARLTRYHNAGDPFFDQGYLLWNWGTGEDLDDSTFTVLLPAGTGVFDKRIRKTCILRTAAPVLSSELDPLIQAALARRRPQ